ncbi:MAG: DUF1573 domain-containing protein [Fimbriimonadales bacterium]|nr:DUF1573 domain-containing protein [Fimbriimonadales bacterium]
MLALLAVVSVLGPVPPLGARAEFLRASLRVQEELEAGRFDRALELCGRTLPSSEIALGWELDASARGTAAAFAVARERALLQWREAVPSLRWRSDAPPALVLRIARDDRPSARLTWGESEGSPRLVAEIRAATADDARNGVLLAVGAWLGLDDSIFPDQAMAPLSRPSSRPNPVTRREAALARELLSHAQRLRALAQSRQRLQAARPRALVRVAGAAPGEVVQGEAAAVPVVLVNAGNAPLLFRTTSACGCMASVPSGEIAPGRSLRLDALLDTTEFQGPLEKSLWILTNSADAPRTEVVVRTRVLPRYEARLPRAVVDAEGPSSFEMALETPASAPLRVLSATLEGLPGTVSVGEVRRMDGRHSLPLLVRLEAARADGRFPANVVLSTDDPRFPVIRLPFVAQRGLAAMPGSAVLRPGPEGAVLSVVSPGREFAIRAVEASDPRLHVERITEGAASEHRLRVRWIGAEPESPVTVRVRVLTDWMGREALALVQVSKRS